MSDTMGTTRNALPSEVDRIYSDITVPVDFTSLGWRVLPLAEQLAHGFRVPVHLLHVDTSSPWSDDDPELLRLRATPFRRPVQVQVVPDSDVAMGVARAITGRESLVVMGSHAHTGATDMFVDSSTDDILRALDGPVVLGGPKFRDGRVPLKRIVCCLDLDAPPPGLLRDVVSWAKHLSLGIELLTVLPTGRGEPLVEMREQERRLALLADQLHADGLDATAVVLRGSRPGHEIVDYANDSPGTVIALTTHARTASVRAVVGSVGMKVVRHATGPVLLRRRDSS
jgi:nucleotide-binding universal stress UspA family protein